MVTVGAEAARRCKGKAGKGHGVETEGSTSTTHYTPSWPVCHPYILSPCTHTQLFHAEGNDWIYNLPLSKRLAKLKEKEKDSTE